MPGEANLELLLPPLQLELAHLLLTLPMLALQLLTRPRPAAGYQITIASPKTYDGALPSFLGIADAHLRLPLPISAFQPPLRILIIIVTMSCAAPTRPTWPTSVACFASALIDAQAPVEPSAGGLVLILPTWQLVDLP